MKKRKMPIKEQIRDYWKPIAFDIPDDTNICWGCGFKSITYRCHIKDKVFGGSDREFNLVLLCRSCHHLQELEVMHSGETKFIERIKDGAPYMSLRWKFYHSIISK